MMDMSFDEIASLPPLTEDELAIINNARPIPSEDCPKMNSQELKQFHPRCFLSGVDENVFISMREREKKTDICLRKA